MKPIIIILLVSFFLKGNSQNKMNSFQGGIEAGLSFTTIQPYYQNYQLFFDNINYGKTTQPRIGIFVNHYISEKHKLELGLFYTEKGTAYCPTYFPEIPILFANDCNGKSLNYIEIPVTLYYYPNNSSNFSYCFSAGYLKIISERGDLMKYDLYQDDDIEASLGVNFKIKKYKWLQNYFFSIKIGGSIFPISNDTEIQLYNDDSDVNIY
ncbi:MAG: hypothetical protein PF541_15870, partial [Prolixibacteraceae bacterium]|nr:hypothetical protein [Prolixibacteraceae bacterium]